MLINDEEDRLKDIKVTWFCIRGSLVSLGNAPLRVNHSVGCSLLSMLWYDPQLVYMLCEKKGVGNDKWI